MTARRALRLAAYWLPVLGLAAIASIVAAIPFTGGTASAAGVIASGLVLLAGLVCEPQRKDRQ